MTNQPKKVAKTGAERARAYRERIKANKEKYDVYKAQNKERKSVKRKSKILSSSEVAHQKMLNRERVRRCRQKKKEEFIKRSCNSLDDVSRAYQTPQALGKAVGKVRKHLPSSPRKRKAVVCSLASLEIPLKKKILSKTQGNKGIPDQISNLVREFYQLDSVSRQAPGRKDFVTVKQSQEKSKSRKSTCFVLWEKHTQCLWRTIQQ